MDVCFWASNLEPQRLHVTPCRYTLARAAIHLIDSDFDTIIS